MAVAAEVPSKFDVVLNGEGFRFAESEERAAYGLTPTFAPRRAESYGDNQFDFWLTASQNDWSLGEGQKYFRADDDERSRRYYGGQVTITTEGEATCPYSVSAINGALSEAGVTGSVRAANSTSFVYAGATTLFLDEVSQGVHGLGATPSPFGMVSDGTDIYLTTTSSGTVGVRKWNGSAFSTFSASPADALGFLNNTLYGFRKDTAKLVRWDTAGAQTDIFQWKQADGDARTVAHGVVREFGGSLLVLLADGPNGGELWTYNGVAPTMTAVFGDDFYAYDIEVLNGVIFVSGFEAGRATIYYVANGTIGLLYRASDNPTQTDTAPSAIADKPALAVFNGRLVFTQGADVRIYDPVTGSISEPFEATTGISSYATPRVVASSRGVRFIDGTTRVSAWPSSLRDNGTLNTSLFDFDVSLTKYFKSVKFDFDATPVGTAVRAGYGLDTIDSSTTNINSGNDLTSGTEYAIGASGRSIRLSITLAANGSSTPTLRRIYIRAAPILDQFKRREYVLDLSGEDGSEHIQLRDGTLHTKDGHALAESLNTTMLLTTPFSITDRFGTFTGLIEPDGSQIIETRPGVYRATIRVREV